MAKTKDDVREASGRLQDEVDALHDSVDSLADREVGDTTEIVEAFDSAVALVSSLKDKINATAPAEPAEEPEPEEEEPEAPAEEPPVASE